MLRFWPSVFFLQFGATGLLFVICAVDTLPTKPESQNQKLKTSYCAHTKFGCITQCDYLHSKSAISAD
jgi:hypothetical protein